MEKQKITLETATTFHLPISEQRTFYIYYALTLYSYLRKPNYNENRLLEKLCCDIRKHAQEAQRLSEQFPNDHGLNRILYFFNNHYNQLLKVIEVEKELEQGKASTPPVARDVHWSGNGATFRRRAKGCIV